MPPVPDDDEGLGSEEAEAEAAREEYEEFRRWLRMRNRGGSRYERQTRTTTRRYDDEDDDDGGGGEFRTNAGPPPSWDGVQCPFEDYLIRARIWISTTKARAQTRGPLLLKALSDTPFQDFKHLAKDPAWLSDPGNAESLLKRMDSPEYYGDDQEEHLLASLARITYHLKRQKNETARQFLGRWEAAERKVAEHKVSLPSLYRGFLMINALGLTDGEIKTLLTFTHGSIEPKDVKTWLRKHETKLQAGQLGNEATTRGKSTPAAVHAVETAPNEMAEPSGEEEEIETMEAMLADLADEEEPREGPGVFEEDEAAEILAMMIKEKKKTYSQSAQIKKDKELGRGYRQGGGPSGSRDRYGPFRPGTYKLSIAELKQRTRCKRCDKVGHWHKECTNPPAPGHTRDPKETHLLEIDLEQYDDALFCHYLESAVNEDASEESDGAIDILSQSTEPNGCGKGRENFDMKHQESELDYMPGRVYDVLYSDGGAYNDHACATLDTGCQRTAVGADTLGRMKPFWPSELPWYKQKEQNKFRSVHGVSQTEYNAVIPCSLGRRGCFLKPAVFEGSHSRNAPLLLSLKFLLQSEAVISLRQGRLSLHLTKHGAQIPLHIGPSGALRVELNNFTGTMMHALSQSKKHLTGGYHGEFEVLNLSAIQPDLKSDSAHPKAPASASGACGRHGLLVTDQQACPRAAEPGEGQCDLHRVAQPCATCGDVFAPGGPTGHAGVQQLGGRLAQPRPGEPEGTQAGATSGSSGRRGRDLDEAERQGVRALHEVPGLEENQEGDRRRELQSSGKLCGGKGGGRQVVDVRVLPQFGVHALQPPDREPRKTVGDTLADGGTTQGATTTEANVAGAATAYVDLNPPERKYDAPERQHEIRPDLQQDEQQGYQQGCRRDGDQDQCREECHRDGQDGPAGDLHPGLPHHRAQRADLCLPPRLQGGVERHDPEPQQSVLQMLGHGADQAVRVLPMGERTAPPGRQVHRDPPACGAGVPTDPDSPGDPGQDPPGRVPALLQGRDGVECLLQERALPCLQQTGDNGTSPDDGDDGRGERGRERQGGLRCHGVHSVSPVEEGALLSGRQWKRMKGSLRQADRQWKATFEFLQVTADQPPLEVDGKGQRKQLGQALNMSDLALKGFRKGLDEIGGDMSFIKDPQGVDQLLDMYRQACDLRPNLLVLCCTDPTLCNERQFCIVLQQCLQHAVKQGQLFVCISSADHAGHSEMQSVALPMAQPGPLHVMTNWSEFLECVKLWTGRSEVSLDELLKEVRQALASSLRVPCQRVHVHDSADQRADSLRHCGKFAQELGCNPEELEQLFTRRVRARTQPPAGDHEEREPRHDSPEGDSRDGPVPEPERSRDVVEGREPLHDSAEGDSRDGPVPGYNHQQGEEPPLGAGVGLEERDLPGSRGRTLRQLVRRAHDGLGHPHRERFVRILRAAKASDEVIQIAKELKCSVCEKFLTVKPPRKAAPPRELGINEVIGMDTVWLPTVGQKKKKVALNIIDYASHFQMMIPLKGRSPEATWSAYRQWVKFFGPPSQIWADQGSEFKGSFKARTAQEGTRMDPSSLEAPTQRGLAERHGKTFKIMLEKTMADYNCSSYAEWVELVDTTMMTKNRLASRGGFSPVQRVLGFLPRLPGGLLSGGQDDAEAGTVPRLGDAGIRRAMDMRKAAAKAFFEVDCDQALRNVLAGGPRPHYDYMVGQMVYFYRLGHSKKGDRPHQRWHGPARVVMTDYPSTIWLSYQGNLVKAAPERIRPGSEEENLTISGWLDGLSTVKEEFEKQPKRSYIDLSDEPLPDPAEFPEDDNYEEEQGDDHHDEPPRSITRRLRGKTDPQRLAMDTTEPETPGPNGPAASAAILPAPTVPSQDDQVEMQEDTPIEMPPVDEDDDNIVEPPSKKTRVHVLEAYYAKLETLFKTRQRKEVRLKDLNNRDLQSFLKAAEKEVHNNLDTNAYEKLDAKASELVRRTRPDRIMESRFVRTVKPLEPGDVDKASMDGTLLSEAHGGLCKAKVRHVMKGFSEDGAEELDSATPQVTREGVMFVTQLIASKRWRLGFLDFTQAFHSGDPINRELYAEQPPEGDSGYAERGFVEARQDVLRSS